VDAVAAWEFAEEYWVVFEEDGGCGLLRDFIRERR